MEDADYTDLSAYEADMDQQLKAEFPAALNVQQEEHNAYVSTLFNQFVECMKKKGITEESLIAKNGHEAFGVVLGFFLEWLMMGSVSADGRVTRHTVGLRYFEVRLLKKVCMLVRQRFPNLACHVRCFSVSELKKHFRSFQRLYDHWSACVGGSKAEAAVSRALVPPAFSVDTNLLTSSVEPTAEGIRWKAVIATLADAAVGIRVLYVQNDEMLSFHSLLVCPLTLLLLLQSQYRI